jgi:methionyl-tRNA formyltransferase
VGRKKILTSTPIKILAEENNIKVLQPEKLKPSSQPSPSREKEQNDLNIFFNQLK